MKEEDNIDNQKLIQKKSIKRPIFFISLVAVIIILGVLIKVEPWLWFVESIYIDTPTLGYVSWEGNAKNADNINLVIRFKNGSIWRPNNNSVIWKSSDKDIISVKKKHKLTVNKTGSVVLSARLFLFSTKRNLIVTKTEQNIKIISPKVVKLLPYSSIDLQKTIVVEYKFSDGTINTGSPDISGWYTTDKNIATVTEEGIIIGWTSGKCQLYCNNHEQKLSVDIEVMPATANDFSISEPVNKNFIISNNVIYVNSNLFSTTHPLELKLTANCEGNILPISDDKLLRWTTKTNDTLVILPDGKLLPLNEGIALVDVYIGDIVKTITIQISNQKADLLIPNTNNVVVNKDGIVPDIMIKARFTDGSIYDITNLVNWNSSNSFVAKYDKISGKIVVGYPGETKLSVSYNSLSADILLSYKEDSNNGN